MLARAYSLAVLALLVLAGVALATHTNATNIVPANYTDNAGSCENTLSPQVSNSARYVLVGGMRTNGQYVVRFVDAEQNNEAGVFQVKNDGTITWDGAVGSTQRAQIAPVLEEHENSTGNGYYFRVSFRPILNPYGGLGAPFNGASYEWDRIEIACIDANALRSWTLPASPDSAMIGHVTTYVSGSNPAHKIGFLFNETGTPELPIAPSGISATGGDRNVFLEWTTNARTSHILIYNRTTLGSPCPAGYNPSVAGMSLVANLTTPRGDYLHSPLVNGLTYGYCVGAYNLTTNNLIFGSYVSAIPGTNVPILTARAWRANAELEWTFGGLTSVTASYLYKGTTLLNMASYVTLNNANSTYEDPQEPGDCFYYSVQVANNTILTGLSHPVQVCYRPPPAPLFGENGAVCGTTVNDDGTYDGSCTELAEAFGIPKLALNVLFGIVVTMATTLFGYSVFRGIGAAVGACLGIVASMMMGFFPVWLVFLVGVLIAAGFVLVRRASGSVA